MKRYRSKPHCAAALIGACLLLAPFELRAQRAQTDRIGDTYEIRLDTTSETTGDGMTGSSRSRHTLTERVVGLRDNDLELEFDFPAGTPTEDKARNWQIPARVLKARGRPLELLNESELQTRLDAWLKLGHIPRDMCGKWMFTWTAIKIECEPQSVVQFLAPFDLRPDSLSIGALYAEQGVKAPVALRAGPPVDGSPTLVAEMEIDTDMVRRDRADADVAIAQMMGEKPPSLESAMKAREAEAGSGSVTTTLEVDATGRVTRRTSVSRLDTVSESGALERVVTTQIVNRRLIPRTAN